MKISADCIIRLCNGKLIFCILSSSEMNIVIDKSNEEIKWRFITNHSEGFNEHYSESNSTKL